MKVCLKVLLHLAEQGGREFDRSLGLDTFQGGNEVTPARVPPGIGRHEIGARGFEKMFHRGFTVTRHAMLDAPMDVDVDHADNATMGTLIMVDVAERFV